MCYFFSVISDGFGNVRFFDPTFVRENIQTDNRLNYNSHTSIAVHYNIPEDKWNKWEYDPFNKTWTEDRIVTTNDLYLIKDKIEIMFDDLKRDELLELTTLYCRIIVKYKDGEMNGEYKEFYKNGNLYIKANYKDDKREGKYEKFYENGNLYIKANYKNGEMNGKYEEFYENGNLCEKINYKDGKKEGEYEEFYENGNLWEKANYKNGKKEGKCEVFYENGDLYRKVNYKNGELI